MPPPGRGGGAMTAGPGLAGAACQTAAIRAVTSGPWRRV